MSRNIPIVPTGKVRDERRMIQVYNNAILSMVVSSNDTITDIQYMTTAEYQALSPPDADTVYITTDPEGIYVGDKQVADISGQTILGLYNAPGDNVEAGIGTGSPIQSANNYQTGEYYVVSAGGTCSSPLPELNGQVLAVNDRLYADATANKWLIVSTTGDFLSRLVDDSAAGVITFEQPAKGTLAAVNVTDYIRKGESDSNDSDIQSDLDAHKGDTTIHFDKLGDLSDVTITNPDAGDIIIYNPGSGQWENGNITGIALMGGDVDNFTLDTTPTILTNYTNFGDVGTMLGTTNPTAGTITIPATGVYTVRMLVVGTQGNDTKEESAWMFIRGSTIGDVTISVFDIATDKTDLRSFNAVFTRTFNVGEALSMGLQASAGLGTFDTQAVTFEVEFQPGVTFA